MSELSAEQAMRRACDLILAGDIMTVAADLMPEAYADAMQLAAGLTAVPTPTGYRITAYQVEGTDHVFRVHFATTLRDFEATATWRQVDGAWKIAGIKVEGLS